MKPNRYIVLIAFALGTQAYAAEFALKAKSFKNEADIPTRFTCEGENVSPNLSWSGAPANTKSFALIADDPDAPDPAQPEKVVTHWVVYNIPKTANTLASGDRLPQGAKQGMNEEKEPKYMGPCPPIGKHHYHFKIFALDNIPHFIARPTKTDLEHEMVGHILAQSELIGLYAKRDRKGD